MKKLINFNKVISEAVKLEGLKHSVTIADGKELVGHFCDQLVKAASGWGWSSQGVATVIGREIIRLVNDRKKKKK